VILSTGSGPGGPWFKNTRPDHFSPIVSTTRPAERRAVMEGGKHAESFKADDALSVLAHLSTSGPSWPAGAVIYDVSRFGRHHPEHWAVKG
jgi:hypothetical protein